jgi:hypothetical protein
LRWPGRLPEEELKLTTLPHPAAAMTGIAARISRMGAITWMSHWACQSASVSASSERAELMPAPLTSTSTRPKRSRHAASARPPASGSVTSRASQVAPAPQRAAPDKQQLRPLGAQLLGHSEADASLGLPFRQDRKTYARPIGSEKGHILPPIAAI